MKKKIKEENDDDEEEVVVEEEEEEEEENDHDKDGEGAIEKAFMTNSEFYIALQRSRIFFVILFRP